VRYGLENSGHDNGASLLTQYHENKKKIKAKI